MYNKMEFITIDRNYGASIHIWNSRNDESISLDLTYDELEVLYDLIYRIREYNEYPRTKEYQTSNNDTIWDDEK